MKRRSRRTVFALDCLEGRLSLDVALAAVVTAPAAYGQLADTTVYVNSAAISVPADPTDGPGLVDPTDPGANDGQLPFTPLNPAPFNTAGPN
jgi:hypothetical protein